MDFTIALKPAWVYLILLFCSVQHSDQTSQKGIEDSIKNLHSVILGKWEDLEYKFSSIDDRLRQVDVLIKNDIKPKLESMEVKVNKIEIEVTTIGLSSTSQSPSEISACGQSPSLDIENALEGAISELKSQGNFIHAAINTLTSNTLSMSTMMDKIGNEIKKDIDSIQLPFEQLNQLSKSYSSGVENLTSQISSDIKEDFGLVTDQLTALKTQANTTLHEISLECKPASGITVASLPWHEVGTDKFVRFADYMTWDNARILCKNNCLDLYQPKDAVEVAKYLEKEFSNSEYWIAGRGDGSRQVWVTTGEVVNKTEPWYGSSYTVVGNDRCLDLLASSGYPETRTVLITYSCTVILSVLCG